MNDREGTARRNVNRLVELAICELVETEDPTAFALRQSYPGQDATVWPARRRPLPLPGIVAARQLAKAAVAAEVEALRTARGLGSSWAEICSALGEEFVSEAVQHELPLEVAGWRYAMYRVRPGQEEPPSSYSRRREVFRWSCWTCGGRVEEGHPDGGVRDGIDGHAASCSRYLVEVSREQLRWDLGSDGE